MTNKKRTFAIMIITAIACIIIAIVDGVIQPDYTIKSVVKLVLFLALPIIYSIFDKDIDIKCLFKADRRGMKTCLPILPLIQ